MVTPSTRPASTITHESGTFSGRETNIQAVQAGMSVEVITTPRIGTQPTIQRPGFVQEPSIMRAGFGLQQSYETFALPASTRALIGWQDSDGDGIFDVLDVPLSLTGSGVYDTTTGQYNFKGSASRSSADQSQQLWTTKRHHAEPDQPHRVSSERRRTGRLPPQLAYKKPISNSASMSPRIRLGTASDRRFERRDQQRLEIVGNRPSDRFQLCRWLAFLDTKGEGENNFGDPLFRNISATITRADGTPILSGKIDAKDYAAGVCCQERSEASR